MCWNVVTYIVYSTQIWILTHSAAIVNVCLLVVYVIMALKKNKACSKCILIKFEHIPSLEYNQKTSNNSFSLEWLSFTCFINCEFPFLQFF